MLGKILNRKSGNLVCVDPEEITNYRGMMGAINRSQAVIEFTLDGRILQANEKFLTVMGYSLDEIKGQHHSIFVDPSHARYEEYRRF